MSSTPSANPQLSPVPPQSPPQKKSKVIFWVLGILGGLILCFVLAIVGLGFFVAHKVKEAGFDSELAKKNPGLASAKLMVAFNHDLEIVSSDDSAGTVTIRNKKDGKTLTYKFDTQKNSMVLTDENGKESTVKVNGNGTTANLEVNSPEGSVKIGAGADGPPSWVPVYPGSTPQNTMSITENGKRSGSYALVTQDSVDKVLSYYTDTLKSGGLNASTTTFNANGKSGGTVSGEDNGRNVAVIVGSENDGTHVSVTFGEKKAAQ
jgi:hypothetical protein